jgi:hypothetical protein
VHAPQRASGLPPAARGPRQRREAQRSPTAQRLFAHDPVEGKLLKQVDSLRDLARRARRLSGEVDQGSGQEMLLRYAKELDHSAVRLEQEAVAAKT